MSIITKLKNFFTGKDKLNINAKDRDGDGLIQEGTVFERSADLTVEGVKSKATELSKKVAAEVATQVANAATEVAAELKKPAPKKPAAKKPTTTTTSKPAAKKAQPKKK